MVTESLSAQRNSMAKFRNALPVGDSAAAISDRIYDTGQVRKVSQGRAMRPHPKIDLLVFLAQGQAKLIIEALSAEGASSGAGGEASKLSGHILSFHFPGDIVSIPQTPTGQIGLVALSDLDLIVFAADDFLDAAQGDPAVIRCVLSRSLHALDGSRMKAMQMGHESAQQRLASFLMSMAERICGCTCGACEVELPMSRRDIADSLGLTIETVSRQLSELRKAGLIETQGRSIVVFRDLDTLAHRVRCQSG